jgi:hypothetical protein
MAMDVCHEIVPEEVRYADGVRVACHLYPPGGDGTRRPVPILEMTGADAPRVSAAPGPGSGVAAAPPGEPAR